jgi:hypothetical protein
MGILKKIQGMTHREIDLALCHARTDVAGNIVVAGVTLPNSKDSVGNSVQARAIKACADEAAEEFKAYADEQAQAFDRRAGDLALENAELKALLKDKEAALRRQDSRVDALRRNNTGLQDELTVLFRRENRSLRDIIDDLRCRLSGDDEVSSLKASLQRAKNEIAVLRMEVDLAKGKDSELRQAVNAPQEKSESGPREQNPQPKIVPGDPPKDGKRYACFNLATGEMHLSPDAPPEGSPQATPGDDFNAFMRSYRRPAYVGILDSFMKHATRPVDAEAERAKAEGIRAQGKLAEEITAMAKEIGDALGLDFHVEVIKL